MKINLIIPRPVPSQLGTPLFKHSIHYRFPLRWSRHHSASHNGIGVLLDANETVLDGFMFRHLRDTLAAWIETDEPARVAHCLGIPFQGDYQEDGIGRSEEHTSELQSLRHLVCRLLL